MTKVGREERHMDIIRGSRVKMKKRVPMVPTWQPSCATSAPSSRRSTLSEPEQRRINPWFESSDSFPGITDGLSTSVLRLSVDRFEPETGRSCSQGRIRSLSKSPLRRSKTYRENTLTNKVSGARIPRVAESRKFSSKKPTSCKSVDRNRVPHHSILDVGFDAAVLSVISNIDQISRVPLFHRLHKQEPAYNEKLKSKGSPLNMEENQKEQEVSKQILHYVREREAALEEVKKAKAELIETQSKLYDALNLIEELEKKVPDNKKQKNTKKSPAPKKKPSEAAPSKTPAKSVTANGTKSATITAPNGASVYHPPLDDLDPSANSKQYYWKLAESFPNLPMLQILEAENKFIDADADNSGYIDKDELDTVLSNNVGLFTPKQVEEIFNEVDTNHSESVDFYEVLVILNKLYGKRRTNLPQSVQQNYSKTCSIQ